MTKAIVVERTGDASVMEWRDVDVGSPGPGEALVEQTAVGLNFIDVYFRTGLYPAPQLPFTPGMEGAGRVLAVGEGVAHVAEGDRVAYAGPIGAYAQRRVLEARHLVKVPDGVDDETAAAAMLKGMTARYLLRATHRVQPGQTILFHAAAGGVGLIAGQWARALGATVIGTVSSAQKAQLAEANGYHHVIRYGDEDFVERVREITNGAGCDVVYDSVGRDTFPASLDCLKPRGLWASFGQSSGPLPEINLAILSQKGSLFATRPTLFSYIARRDDLEETAADLFAVIADGTVKISVNQRFDLADARSAHEALEGRRTTGGTVLLP